MKPLVKIFVTRTGVKHQVKYPEHDIRILNTVNEVVECFKGQSVKVYTKPTDTIGKIILKFSRRKNDISISADYEIEKFASVKESEIVRHLYKGVIDGLRG